MIGRAGAEAAANEFLHGIGASEYLEVELVPKLEPIYYWMVKLEPELEPMNF